MQAFIPAAGLGTRLRPLTDQRPKALVEILGTPLLKITIDNLTRQGVSKIVVNVHHFAQLVCDYLHQHSWNAEVIVSDERDLLLDTGGGLKKAANLFTSNEPIIIHNVDVLSAIELNKMLQIHYEKKSIATLAVSQRQSSRFLLFDTEGNLTGWTNTKTKEYLWVNPDNDNQSYSQMSFSGITIIEPKLLDLLPPANKPYPIIPAYLNIAKHHRISQFQHNAEDWIDVGTPERLQQAELWMKQHELTYN